MTSLEIQKSAIASSEKMLAWMKENKKGRDEITVNEIQRKGQAKVFTVRISKRLFTLEAIFFKLSTLAEELDTGAVQVLEYDRDKSLLIIRPKEQYQSAFAAAHAKDLLVITDLRFLVERTRDWFITNGAFLALPTSLSPIREPFDVVRECLAGKLPNEQQRAAIHDIFNKPFSYVWGAPGTGKTQYVLAYSALRYLRAGKRIGIIAPTNLSLEQVLRGLMEITTPAGIHREKILRLGIPTKEFAHEHGDICEVTGIQKKIAEIDSQLKILDKIGGVRNSENDLYNLASRIEEFPEELEVLHAELVEKGKALDAATILLRKAVIQVAYPEKEKKELAEEMLRLVRKRDHWWTKFLSFFGGAKVRIEEDLARLRERTATLEKQQLFDRQDLEKAEQAETAARLAKEEALLRYTLATESMVNLVRGYEWLASLLGADPVKTLVSEPDGILSAIEEKLDNLEGEAALVAVYKDYTLAQIAAKRAQYEAEKAKLAGFSTAERIEKAGIIAVTLDTYLGRYKDEKLPIDHFFLDEAGYANQIKALTLFNHDVPVTFLGDHMQLPPVCEVDDRDIERIAGFENVYLWAESALRTELLFGNYTSDNCRHFYLNNCHPAFERMSRTQLTDTHRFGPALANVLSKFVYSGKFRSARGEGGGDTVIRVIAAKRDINDSHNTSNGEAYEIAKLVPGLKDFVILAPYRNQVALLGNHLPQVRNAERIMTIHKSQGREWDTVILSVTDQSPRVFTDTTSSSFPAMNVINTAVSRAKHELIIVCNVDNWRNWHGQLIQGLVSVSV